MKIVTIEDMCALASKRGGKCLSTTYIDANTKLIWQCSKGHEWSAIPNSIKQGHWCPYCSGTRKGTIEEMQEIAKERGGECLSAEYNGSFVKLKWQCSEGHIWLTTPSHIKSGRWCPECVQKVKTKYTIDYMRSFAESKGGRCLSGKYVNNRTKLLWKCDNPEHPPFEKDFSHIIDRSQWCPICAGKRQHKIEDMQSLAEQRGGKCLSTKYINIDTKLEWECDKGHTWSTIPYVVMSGSWCPTCSGKNKSIEDMRKLAQERGGKCLSTEYHYKRRLTWECGCGYKWKATPASVIPGSWCPKCGGSLPLTLEEVQKLAESKGGKCLSTEYINNRTPMLFECSLGHRWEVAVGHIRGSKNKRGTWCPTCVSGINEQMVRFLMEYLLDCQFPKDRKTIYPLELDGYNNDFGLAFEYQGEQHYEFIPYIHQTYENFSSQVKRDNDKRDACKRLNIELLEVPCYEADTDRKVFNFIVKELTTKGYDIDVVFEQLPWIVFYQGLSRLKDIQDLAASKGGKCLSEEYVNNATHMLFECELGHQWQAVSASIKTGSWCPICAGQFKYAIEDMQKIAEERGGKCLTRSYKSVFSPLDWQCKEGHTWSVAPHSVIDRENKKGSWCPICSHTQKLTIEQFKEIVNSKGGKCLSEAYVNNRTLLVFECEHGHRWQASPSSIKGSKNREGTWCPECAIKKRAIKRRMPIEEVRKIAESKGGKCLSDTYVNNNTPMLFQCSHGHQWYATASNVKGSNDSPGTWCPTCSSSKPLTIDDFKKIAESRSGECLSDVYINNRTPLQFKCAKGHQWYAHPSNIKDYNGKTGSWCPVCGKEKSAKARKGTIEEIQEIARSKGGKCLSPVYENNRTPILFECEHGHQWKASADGIKGSNNRPGTWCPKCGIEKRVNNRRGSIEDVKKIAESRSGKCLSDTYLNNRIPLLFECEHGHQWYASFDAIKGSKSKKGTWCPICKKEKSNKD